MKDGQTIGQWFKWDFEANGDLIIEDRNGNEIYLEALGGYWSKKEYDSKGNQIYYENSMGYWDKREYDSQGNEISFEDSNGVSIDNSIPAIIEHNGHKYQLIL